MQSYRAWKRQTVAALHARSQLVLTASGPIEWASVGTGPAVLVSHGTPGGYDQGLLVAGLLGQARCRFIAGSRPGYLRTPLEVGRPPEQQADAFVAVLEALEIPRAAIVGVSGGGPAALQFARPHPTRCWAVVLLSAITKPRPASERPLGVKILGAILASDVSGWLMSGLIAGTPEWVNRVAVHDPIKPALMRTTAPYSLRRDGLDNDLAQLGAPLDYPLERISSPTLVMHGLADKALPVAHAEFAASTIPNAELVMVVGGDHVCFSGPRERSTVVSFLLAHAPSG